MDLQFYIITYNIKRIEDFGIQLMATFYINEVGETAFLNIF
jgi:hypothetical protein